MTFLVTGVGHSGTGWAARLFTELGFPCGHERQFTPVRHGPLTSPDSSWLAVPRLGELPEGAPVVHLVRDPLAVVRSVMRLGFLTGNPHCRYERFVAENRPGVVAPAGNLDRVIRWVAWWDAPVEDYTPRVVLRVEDAGDTARLADVVESATGHSPDPQQLAGTVRRLGTRINTHAPHNHESDQQVTWETIAARPGGRELLDRARTYGYNTGSVAPWTG